MTETTIAPNRPEVDVAQQPGSAFSQHTGNTALSSSVNLDSAEAPQIETASELAKQIQDVVSPAGIKARKQTLEARFESSDIQHVHRLKQAKWKKYDERLGTRSEEQRKIDVQVGHIDNLLDRTYGRGAIDEHFRLEMALRAINPENPSGQATIEYWGEEGNELVHELTEASPKIDDGIDRTHDQAPGLDPDATRQDFEDYLSKKLFIRPKELEYAVVPDQAEIVIKRHEGKPFKVPVSNIVSAGSFSSWFGNGGGKAYVRSSDGEYVTGSSDNAIMDYARRPTPLPPLEEISAFVQPNGIVIFKASTSNHRTAAAIARGATEVEVDGSIDVRLIDKNFIPLEQTSQPK